MGKWLLKEMIHKRYHFERDTFCLQMKAHRGRSASVHIKYKLKTGRRKAIIICFLVWSMWELKTWRRCENKKMKPVGEQSWIINISIVSACCRGTAGIFKFLLSFFYEVSPLSLSLNLFLINLWTLSEISFLNSLVAQIPSDSPHVAGSTAQM